MEHLRSLYADHPYRVVGAIWAVPLAYVVYRKLQGCCKKQPSIACPPDTVQLFQLSRGPYAPSMSNFPIKLETYLRMANIPYISNNSGKMSPKGKTPFMVYNGELVSDSQFCIEYLSKKLSVDVNKSLNKEERAVAKAIQIMVDEHLYWTFAYFRWSYDKTMRFVRLGIPEMNVRWYFWWVIARQLYGQGIGRHTTEEIKHIMLTDLQALSDYLGDKPFMMGETPCEVDCSVFGLLSQFIWHIDDDICNNLVKDKFPILYNYSLRMKERFWPDWDDCITHGGTKPAIK